MTNTTMDMLKAKLAGPPKVTRRRKAAKPKMPMMTYGGKR